LGDPTKIDLSLLGLYFPSSYYPTSKRSSKQAMESLNKITCLLDQLVEKIDENTQSDDVTGILVVIESQHHQHELLREPYFLFYKGMYEAKGAMSEVHEELQEMKDACFQQKLFYLLTEGM